MNKKLTQKAVEFYQGFDPEFLKELDTIASAVGIPPQTLMSAMLMKSSAFSYGWLQVFGTQNPGFLSEVRFDAKGDVISGPRLLRELTQEAVDHLQDMKNKLERGIENKQAVVIDKESMAVFQECLL